MMIVTVIVVVVVCETVAIIDRDRDGRGGGDRYHDAGRHACLFRHVPILRWRSGAMRPNEENDFLVKSDLEWSLLPTG